MQGILWRKLRNYDISATLTVVKICEETKHLDVLLLLLLETLLTIHKFTICYICNFWTKQENSVEIWRENLFESDHLEYHLETDIHY